MAPCRDGVVCPCLCAARGAVGQPRRAGGAVGEELGERQGTGVAAADDLGATRATRGGCWRAHCPIMHTTMVERIGREVAAGTPALEGCFYTQPTNSNTAAAAAHRFSGPPPYNYPCHSQLTPHTRALQNSGAPAGAAHAAAEQAVRTTFAHAGQYIALAYALQPSKPVYADSLAAVQRLLPLPYLRSGAGRGREEEGRGKR